MLEKQKSLPVNVPAGNAKSVPAPAARAAAAASPGVAPAADLFSQLRAKHEVTGLREWSFADLPEAFPAGTAAGAPIFAWPGLSREKDGTHLRLFRSRAEAEDATAVGLIALAETALKSELSGIDYALSKDLKSLHLLWLTLGTGDQLLAGAKGQLRRHLMLADAPPLLPLTKAGWEERVRRARAKVPGLVAAYLKTLRTILEQRDLLLTSGEKAYPGAASDMLTFLPKDFLETRDYAEFPRLLRWLRARLLRRERHMGSPFKDAEKAQKLKPYLAKAETLAKLKAATPEQRAALAEFRRLLEEFRVSVFAPEVGTEGKVSPAILDAHLTEVNRLFGLK